MDTSTYYSIRYRGYRIQDTEYRMKVTLENSKKKEFTVYLHVQDVKHKACLQETVGCQHSL